MPSLNAFPKDKDVLEPEDPKEILLHSLIRDIASQLKPKRIEANHELLKGLTDAAAAGGLVEDRQYVVSTIN